MIDPIYNNDVRFRCKTSNKSAMFCKTIMNNSMIKYGTLDQKHKEQIEEFENQRRSLPKLIKNIVQINKKIEELKKMPICLNIKYELMELTKKRNQYQEDCESILERQDELFYYNNVLMNVLMKYYDNTTTNKAALFSNYISIICHKNILNNEQLYTIPNCIKCKKEKTIFTIGGDLICDKCGDIDYMFIDTDKIKYKDIVSEPKVYMYKRINHLTELLNQFQAKETINITKEQLDNIKNELKKNRITDYSKLNRDIMKSILQNLNMNKQYEHIPYIIYRLSGGPPPDISKYIATIHQMFKDVLKPYSLFKQPERKNLINYCHILKKIFQLLELDEYISLIPVLKSRKIIKEQDELWEKICDYLNWQYIPS